MRQEELPVAIDIGAHGVKVAQVVLRSGQPSKVRVGFAAFAPDFVWNQEAEDSPVLEAIQRALQDAGIRTKHAVCIIPRQQITLRFSELPQAHPEEASKMAALEAEQHIPLPAADTVIGYEMLGLAPAENGLRPVLIAAARKGMVQAYRSLLSDADLKIAQVTIDTLCLYRLWQREATAGESALLLDIGAKNIAINLLEEGILRMSRSIPLGGDELTTAFQKDFKISQEEAEELKRQEGLAVLSDKGNTSVHDWVGRLTAEIRRSLLALSTSKTQPNKIYLTGGGGLLPGINRYLEENLGLRTAQLLSSEGLLPSAQSSIFSLAIAASLQAHQTSEILNLVLPEMVVGQTQERRRKTLWGVSVAIGVALLTFVGGTFLLLQQRHSAIESMADDWNEAKQIRTQARILREKKDTLISQTQFLSREQENKHYFLDLLLQLHERAPEKTWLTNLTLEKTTDIEDDREIISLQAGGKVPDNRAVADLLSSFSKIPGLQKIDLQNAKAARYGEKQVVEFTLSCQVMAPKTNDETDAQPERPEGETE